MRNVSSEVIKYFLRLAIREITVFYNMVLDTGISLDKWKSATVIPVPKVANAPKSTDLREISLPLIPGKLICFCQNTFFGR